MIALSRLTIILGVLICWWHLVLCLVPRAAGTWLLAFPRQVWAGRILAALAVGWVAILVWQADIAWLERYRVVLCALAPVFYALIVAFVDELLAARALGGLLLLVPALILEAAFACPFRSRLVMTGLAYLLAIVGMVLVWSPFMFRKMTAPWAGRPAACRLVGVAGTALGVGLLCLGWLAYR